MQSTVAHTAADLRPTRTPREGLSDSFIGIAGLIGVGKSTLARSLGETLGIDTYYEPVQDNEYLSDFYEDPGRHGFAMQVYLLNRRFQQHQEIIWKCRAAVQDRTIYEDSIFAKVLADLGLMHPRDYQTYLGLFEHMAKFMCRPTAIVYLHCRPSTCYERIQNRGRKIEKTITLDYLERLYGEYERFVGEISRTIPVIRVEWSEFQDVERVADAITVEVRRASYLRDVTL